MDYSNKTCCVIDNGLFAEFATELAKHFGKVYLFCPWVSAYPKSNQIIVGTGLERVEKIDDFWPILDKVDLFVFPDIYFGGLQEHLVSLGKRVWGSRMGEELELFRDFSKSALEEVGCDIGSYALIEGMDNLRDYLKDHENVFVKISRTRGDFETFKSVNYMLSEPRLDEIEHKLGAKKNIQQFIVEDMIDDAVEVGYDGYTVDGQFPTLAMSGIEIKDKGYVGHISNYKQLAKPVRNVNQIISPLLYEYKYRNFWSAEARITRDGKAWVIDPCCRAGSPPSELGMKMYTNLADIFWFGAEGVCIDPKPAAEWGAEVMLISAWANHNWQAIEFPPEIRDNVVLHFPVVIDGKYYLTPQGFDLPCIGAVVAIGNTMQEATKKCKELAEQVKGFYVEAPVDCFDLAQEELKKLKEFGYHL